MTTRNSISQFKAVLIWVLVFTTFGMGFMPQPAVAAMLPSTALLDGQSFGPDREASLKKIQTLLESKQIRQRLADLGLTETEIVSRLGQLSDEQIHQIAMRLDSLQPGGDVLGTVVVLLVIAILVVVLLQVSGHKIIITK